MCDLHPAEISNPHFALIPSLPLCVTNAAALNGSYRERLTVTGLESLEVRRLIYDLVCTYKILSNKLLPPDTLIPGSPGPVSYTHLTLPTILRV